MMKRDAELLLERIAAQNDTMRETIEYLADPCFEKTPDDVVRLSVALHERMRLQQIDVARSITLAQGDAVAMRAVYSQSVLVVDALRGCECGDPEQGLAYIQQTMTALFPGDVLEA